MGGANSRHNAGSPGDWQQNNEKIGRLSHLLALKSEHRDIVASRGWDKTQKEMVSLKFFIFDGCDYKQTGFQRGN